NRLTPGVPGMGDGRLDGDDLTWYDRFANGLSCPQTSSNEFQRMDTAPLGTNGDGALGTDRNQLERLIAGQDARQPGGGPLTPNTPFCTGTAGAEEMELKSAPVDPYAVRALRIGSVTGAAGS